MGARAKCVRGRQVEVDGREVKGCRQGSRRIGGDSERHDAEGQQEASVASNKRHLGPIKRCRSAGPDGRRKVFDGLALATADTRDVEPRSGRGVGARVDAEGREGRLAELDEVAVGSPDEDQGNCEELRR